MHSHYNAKLRSPKPRARGRERGARKYLQKVGGEYSENFQ